MVQAAMAGRLVTFSGVGGEGAGEGAGEGTGEGVVVRAAMSRSNHPQGDMAVTITITVESHFSSLAASFEAKESPK